MGRSSRISKPGVFSSVRVLHMRVYVFPLLGGYQNSAINLEQHALHPPRPVPSGFDGTQRPSEEEEGGPWGSMPTRSAYAYTMDGNSSMSSSLRNHSSSAELDPLQCTLYINLPR